MGGDGFEINSRDICLMCLSACPPFNINTKRQLRISTFKMLMHYLKIDVMEIFDFPIGFGFDEEEIDYENTQFHALVNTCDKCFTIFRKFSILFEQYKAIRVKLDECLNVLFGSMISGGENKELVREYQRQMANDVVHDRIARRLRKETLQKCKGKLKKSNSKARNGREHESDPVHGNNFSPPLVRVKSLLDKDKQNSKKIESKINGKPPISYVPPNTDVANEAEDNGVDMEMTDNSDQDISILNGLKIVIKTEELGLEFEPEEPEDYYKAHIASSSTLSPSLTDNDNNPLEKPICRVCGVTVNSFKALQGHMTAHKTRASPKGNSGPKCRGPGLSKSGKPRLPCPTCGKYFSSNVTLWRHQRDVHTGFVARACVHCLKNYPSASLYRKHLKTNHPREYFSKFLIIPEQVTDIALKQVVVNFSSEWTRMDPNTFKCKHCEQSCNMKANILTHLLVLHIDILVERMKEYLVRHNYEVKEHYNFTNAKDYRIFEDYETPDPDLKKGTTASKS